MAPSVRPECVVVEGSAACNVELDAGGQATIVVLEGGVVLPFRAELLPASVQQVQLRNTSVVAPLNLTDRASVLVDGDLLLNASEYAPYYSDDRVITFLSSEQGVEVADTARITVIPPTSTLVGSDGEAHECPWDAEARRSSDGRRLDVVLSVPDDSSRACRRALASSSSSGGGSSADTRLPLIIAAPVAICCAACCVLAITIGLCVAWNKGYLLDARDATHSSA